MPAATRIATPVTYSTCGPNRVATIGRELHFMMRAASVYAFCLDRPNWPAVVSRSSADGQQWRRRFEDFSTWMRNRRLNDNCLRFHAKVSENQFFLLFERALVTACMELVHSWETVAKEDAYRECENILRIMRSDTDVGSKRMQIANAFGIESNEVAASLPRTGTAPRQYIPF